ncbi:hypothetical protein ACTFIZ_006498 [Dictyostelium cf. discoideum]
MNCGSKYTFVQDEEEEEEDFVVDNDIFLQGAQQQQVQQQQVQQQQVQQQQVQQQPQQQQSRGLFGIFGRSAAPSAPSAPAPAPINRAPNQFKAKIKKATTNVLVVNLGTVAKDSSIQTGDGYFCKKCNCGFSNINALKEITLSDGKKHPNIPTDGGFDGNKTWKCEFCYEENEIIIDKEEIPQSNIIDYILESEPVGDVNNNNNKTKEEKEKDEKEKNEKDDSFVIFCIDISGSMEVTQSVNGLSIPSSLVSNPGIHDNEPSSYEKQALTKVSYVSRLQCVQIGLLHQIESIAEKYPNKRVGIVTFSDKVTMFGDGSTEPVTISDRAKLLDLSQLVEEGGLLQMNNPVSKTKNSLLEKVKTLRGNGSTALGSAVAACVGITGSSRGSQIIICTDGQSNMGLGATEAPEKQQMVFEQIANMAQRSGTSISVLTIKGTDTKLEVIGKLANNTGGEVNIMDPINLNDGFKEILSLPTLATNVSVKLFLHKGLYISDYDKNNNIEKSFVERVIGNVNQDTTISFEYGVRSSKLIDKSLKSIPFQLQIFYTTLTGKKCVRMITQTQEITTSSDLAEEHANIEALGINMVQTSTKIASSGDYEQSRAKNYSHAGLMQKVMMKKQKATKVDSNEIDSMSNYMQQAHDIETHLSNTVSNEKSFSSSGDRLKSRQQNRDDATANMLYNMSNMNSAKSKKKFI